MGRDGFAQRKKDVLLKSDKSSIGGWDKKIVSLCREINKSDDFYTTSSCSGRILLMVEQDKKSPNLFIKLWHDKITFESLKKELDKINSKKLIKLKLEQPILHIACRNLDVASELLEKAKHLGFKRSGILTIRKNIVIELNSTEKLEFPILEKGKILVDDEFLKIIVKISNEKLEKGWNKIKKLKEVL